MDKQDILIGYHYFIQRCYSYSFFFFFNDTATTEIYTLSLHDALPISGGSAPTRPASARGVHGSPGFRLPRDRKSTRLNSSHLVISYAVFCLKKKNRSLASFLALVSLSKHILFPRHS